MDRVARKPFVSDKLARKRKSQAKLRRFFSLCIVLAVLSGVGYVMYANRFQLQGVDVTGSQAVPAEEIVAYANDLIAGKRFYIFPRRNIFLYSKSREAAELASAFPRLKTITISVVSQRLAVVVTEREPAYMWCGETIPETRQASFESTCYFVDSTGYIFSLAPQFSDSVYQRIYTSLNHPDAPIGQFAMSATTLTRVSSFAKEITSQTFEPSAYSITSDGDALIFLYRDSDTSPVIRYNPLHDPLTVVAQFKAAIASEPLHTKLSFGVDALEYIDVRFPNKIFYKFTDDAGQQQDTTKK